MPGTDVYSGTFVDWLDWSTTLTYLPAANGTPDGYQVGGLSAQAVELNGTVAAVGDSVTMVVNQGTPEEVDRQLSAVADVQGGAIFSDGFGDTYLFADGALAQGSTYDVVPGFGSFAAGPPQPACFAAGTLIETRNGPVAVQDLRPGDPIRVLLRGDRDGGFAPVVWTGRMPIACTRHPKPQDVWPVRVAAGAFGAGRPTRDLLLSPDHAVHEGGVLVPIRHLLNDCTIAQLPIEQVTYWHVELPTHDVLLAEGLAAESYLDTGNRGAFLPGPGSGEGLPTVVSIDRRASGEGARRIWERHGCARLVTEDAELVAMRRRLRELARIAGWRETGDAALQLQTGSGAVLLADWNGTTATATIPPGTSVLQLHSRSTVPSQMGEGSTDFRRLGVAVTRLRIDGREVRLDDARMRDGWHRMEGGWRWTDGEAAIPLTPLRQPRSIEVHTAPMLAYWQTPPTADAALRAA